MSNQSHLRRAEITAAPVSKAISATSPTVGADKSDRIVHSSHPQAENSTVSMSIPAKLIQIIGRGCEPALIGLLVVSVLAPTSIFFSAILPHVTITCLITSAAEATHTISSLIKRHSSSDPRHHQS